MHARLITAHLAIMFMAGDIDYHELGDYLTAHFGARAPAAARHVFRCTAILDQRRCT